MSLWRSDTGPNSMFWRYHDFKYEPNYHFEFFSDLRKIISECGVTPREKRILWWIISGYSHEEVGRKMRPQITRLGVNRYLSRIKYKLQKKIHSRDVEDLLKGSL